MHSGPEYPTTHNHKFIFPVQAWGGEGYWPVSHDAGHHMAQRGRPDYKVCMSTKETRYLMGGCGVWV